MRDERGLSGSPGLVGRPGPSPAPATTPSKIGPAQVPHRHCGPDPRTFGRVRILCPPPVLPANDEFTGVGDGGARSAWCGDPGADQSVRDDFLTFTEAFEGRVPAMYLDIRGLVTTAVGNLIDTEEDACRLSWTRVDGTPATDAEIRAGVAPGQGDARAGAPRRERRRRRDRAAADRGRHRRPGPVPVRREHPDPSPHLRRWDRWPADAQLGCHSILWSGSFFPLDSHWPRFNAAARARDWAAAAGSCREQDWTNRRAAARNAANHELFMNAAAVEAQGLDATELYRLRYPFP